MPRVVNHISDDDFLDQADSHEKGVFSILQIVPMIAKEKQHQGYKSGSRSTVEF
jgi:hypothetical protein